MAKTAVVALGGNALTREGQSGTYEEMEANANAMARSVASLLRAGWRVVIVHGNGPQVGNLAIQQEEGAKLVPAQPLFSLGAMSEGQLGSLISLALRRVSTSDQTRGAVAVVTHVVVNPDDPAFDNPTKFIGPFLSKEQAESMGAERGWVVKKDGNRGYRRVVPSPDPVAILETAAIRSLVEQRQVVIAAGGGGVPVIRYKAGYGGVDAVIDKDYAAQVLATSIPAEALVLVTAVDTVLLHYGTPEQKAIHEMAVSEAEGVPGDRRVPGREHGPQSAGRRALPASWRRAGGDHLAGAGLRFPQGGRNRARRSNGHQDRPGQAADRFRLMVRRVKVFPDRYVDSVLQMAATRSMLELDGVEWAAAAMATPANIEILAGKEFGKGELGGASANDLFIAVEAEDEEVVDKATAAGEGRLFSSPAAGGGQAAEQKPRSLGEAIELQPGTNVAIISVPGDYAAMEAHKALSAGLHVLLFSDNVSQAAETDLKDRAAELGLLVMGPGAGTAMLGSTGLGFANVVKPGKVGVIAAAGTGAQEAMSLLDRWGAGVSHVIGLGGRDLNEQVDGRMARLAVEAMREDPGTEAILLVSKPPAERVAREVVGLAGDTPMVASMVGLTTRLDLPEGVTVVTTLEEGVVQTMGLLGLEVPNLTEGLEAAVKGAMAGLSSGRTLLRGLFSGGTLCYEALVILTEILGPVWSNTPLDKTYKVPAPEGAHVCLDLGEEEYTKGRPHPMIDPEARIEWLREAGNDPKLAVVLIDVVLGYGAHADPAGELAPACAEISRNGGPQIVAYVLGTGQDPQGFDRQRATLTEAGCTVAATNARATLAAAAIALRKPELVGTKLGR